MIVLYGTNGQEENIQPTDIYLEDNAGILTKQNLIDLLIDDIYDSRDGDILKHVSNVDVSITLHNDSTLLNSITQAGLYDVRMMCIDSDNNIGTEFWKTAEETHGVDVITVSVKENKPPVIGLNGDKRYFLINDYTVISKSDLITELVNFISDDRDGLLTAGIDDVKIFQVAEQGTSGSTSGYVPVYNDGTNGVSLIFETITETEHLFINETGEFKLRLTKTDSDGDSTIADFGFDVY